MKAILLLVMSIGLCHAEQFYSVKVTGNDVMRVPLVVREGDNSVTKAERPGLKKIYTWSYDAKNKEIRIAVDFEVLVGGETVSLSKRVSIPEAEITNGRNISVKVFDIDGAKLIPSNLSFQITKIKSDGTPR